MIEANNTTSATKETVPTPNVPFNNLTGEGMHSGQAKEYTAMFPLKPGGALRMRNRLKDYQTADAHLMDQVGTVHDLRFALFDNDTRMLFASTYDGGFEQYIKDFATLIPDHIDKEFGDCEGYPGVRSPEIWDYIARHKIEVIIFYSAYPDTTVRQVWKTQKVAKAFDELLDQAQS